jgi:tetratricopeptide (TPR) repeat protein
VAATPQLSQSTLRLVQQVLAQARAGNVAGARASANSGLRTGEGAEVFHALLGGLDCQGGDFAAGIAHFRAALKLKPSDVAVRCNLVRALTDSGDTEGALKACTQQQVDADPSQRLRRLRSYLLLQSGENSGAIAGYERIVAAEPKDFESWNNLGNALSATGAVEQGLAAIRQATLLRPDNAPARYNECTTLVELGRMQEAEAAFLAYCKDFPTDEKPRRELAALCKLQGRDAEALAHLEEAAKLAPRDPDMQIKLGLERQFAWQMDGAEAALRKAAELDPSLDEAYVLLALHLEHMNKPGEFAQVIRAAETGKVGAGTLHFLNALVCRRDGRFAEGLAELDAVPPDLEPIRVAHLRGQCHDRLGEADLAFASFAEMNRLQQADPSEPVRRASEFREALRADRARVTPEWYAGWRHELVEDGRAAPVFLLGFPRSGTTLLDTMLMGHPGVQVLEERPLIARIESETGGIERLPGLSSAEIAKLRDSYFDEARRWITLRDDALLVDKNPLHLNKVPYIHRLFPDARFILALRHPLDVLLSCYITNFRLNNAMANFLDLSTAASLYDQSFGFWEQSQAIMGVGCHTVVYERMIGNANAELRPLFEYLGLEWNDDVLDHQQTAAGRGVITTASYSQVTEPLYTRAKGRWTRYSKWLEPVMPVMNPWIKRHGYES